MPTLSGGGAGRGRQQRHAGADRRHDGDLGKGQMGSALMGSLEPFMFFDRGSFWVLPLIYFYLPKSARAYLFPQSVKNPYFCSGPISADPICPQPKTTALSQGERRRTSAEVTLDETRRDDTIVQNQMSAQTTRGHRSDPSAQPGGTTHHHPRGPTENQRAFFRKKTPPNIPRVEEVV